MKDTHLLWKEKYSNIILYISYTTLTLDIEQMTDWNQVLDISLQHCYMYYTF
jgi:hypothetical protein